jgi:hypothetical protein
VRAGPAVHAAGEAHEPRALRARRVRDVRLAVRAGPQVVDQPQVRALDRLDQLTGRLDHHRRRQRPIEHPVDVRATGAALDQQMAGPLREERPQCRQPVGLIDVDPQEAGLTDRVLVAPRLRPDGRGEEHLFAGVGVSRGERHQCLQPVIPAGLSAGEEVIGAAAGGDLQASVAAGARGELDQPAGVLVQDAELQGAVALWTERPGEDASVSEPDAAAQCLARGAGAVPGGGGGGCGHRILLAQVWARRPPVPPRPRGCRRS